MTETTQQYEEVVIQLPAKEAYEVILTALQKVGRVQEAQEKSLLVVGFLGSGTWNMNRADMTVQILGVTKTQSKMVFTATAEEGLISQNTAPPCSSNFL